MKKYLFLIGAFLCFVPNCLAMTIDEYFNQISKDGKVEVNTVKPKGSNEAEGLMTYTLNKQFSNDEFYVYGTTNSALSDNHLIIYRRGEDDGILSEYKDYEVEYVFNSYDEKVYNKVQEFVKKIPSSDYIGGVDVEKKLYRIDDLELINYIMAVGAKQENLSMDALNSVINYSGELNQIFKGSNIELVLDTRAGWDSDFSAGAFGFLNLIYNDFAYGVVLQQGIKQNRVFYIPSDTENTREAFIAAAKKRLDDYLGKNNITITYGGEIADIDTTNLDVISLDEIVNVANTIGEYYIFNFDGEEIKFFIEKNDERIKEINFYTQDMKSDASISSSSPDVPLDSKIRFDFLDKASNEFKTLMEKLNLKFGISMDIKLHSNSKKEFITKLENGEFKVYIPLTDEMQNLDLVSYYLREDGTIEEHPITIENGYVVFTTNHFSTYTLGVKNDHNNPNTYDGINKYFLIGGVSLITLVGSLVVAKKKEIKQP